MQKMITVISRAWVVTGRRDRKKVWGSEGREELGGMVSAFCVLFKMEQT